MSKDKKRNSQPVPVATDVVLSPDPVGSEASAVSAPSAPVLPLPPPPPPTRKLADVDRLALELAKQRRQTALAEAKTALAQNENAELAYKYVVLQLYMKYGLTDADAISEAGEIIPGGALPQNQAKNQ